MDLAQAGRGKLILSPVTKAAPAAPPIKCLLDIFCIFVISKNLHFVQRFQRDKVHTFVRFKRKAFITTLTELSDIAAAAMMGESKMPKTG